MSHNKNRHEKPGQQQQERPGQAGSQDQQRNKQSEQHHPEQKKQNPHTQWTKPTTPQGSTGKNDSPRNQNNPRRP